MRNHARALAFLVSVSLALWLTGCSNSFDPMAGTTPPLTQVGAISGSVFGGHQPITGSAIYLYSAGVTGYKSASKSLLTSTFVDQNFPTKKDINGNYYVTSDANGNFDLTGDYTCVSGTQVFLFALGGNTGGGSNNANAGLLSTLGQCPASGTMALIVPTVYVNEVSTVAAAYALAGYAASATSIGGPALTDTMGQTGIANAFLTAGNLFNVGLTASPTVNAQTMTTNGYGTMPNTKMNALANSLAACVTTTGSNATSPNACNTLLTAAGGAADTASAAIYVAQNPSVNVSTIYGVATAGAPYAPALTGTPSDWTMPVVYAGAGGSPDDWLVIDSLGNIWYLNSVQNSFSVNEFTNLGAAAHSPYATAGSAAAIDTSGNLWMTSGASNLVEIVPSTGSITTITPGHLTNATGIAFDGSGNIFVANTNSNDIVKLTSAGVYAGSTQYFSNNVTLPNFIAVEAGPAGNVWTMSNQGGAYDNWATFASNSMQSEGSFEVTADYVLAETLAAAGSGHMWTGDSQGHLIETTSAQATRTFSPLPTTGYWYWEAVAVDGGNNVWASGYGGSTYSLYELNSSGTNLSGTNGYTGIASPLGIDQSGNVWYFSASGVSELVGAGTPTINPISLAVTNSTIGTEP
jgi:hypothetical protein